jgi:hypothetical protein
MAIRGTRDLRVDQLLTNISISYSNLSYIADTLFPVVQVRNQSGLIPTFLRSHWFRDEAKPRAPGTRSEGGSWEPGPNLSYFAQRYSYRDEIPDETRDNADDVYQIEANSVNFVTDKLMMRRERSFAASFFKTGVWADDEDGAADLDFVQWSDYADSSPMVDMTTYQDEIESRIGTEANVMVIGKQGWNSLRWHPDFIELIKYTQTGIITEAMLADFLQIPRIVIGRALYTTDPEGTAEASVTYSRIWGKHALLLYVPPAPALNTPASGYTFTWARVPNSIQYMKRLRDEEREVDIIEGNSYFDQRMTSAAAGTFLANIVA